MMLRPRRSCLLLALLVGAAARPASAQPVQVLHRFTPSTANPNGPLVQLPGGDFYGVTTAGIIRLTTAGQVTEVVRIADSMPVGALVLASDGGLYGTTVNRDSYSGPGGTVFRFDPATGAVRTIHTFSSQTDGRAPLGGLVPVGGSLYGVTRSGPGDMEFVGTIFHVIVATGELVTDFVFAGSGQPFGPNCPLTLGPDGLLYGTSVGGSFGVLYRFNPATGVTTTLREFSAADGAGLGDFALAPGGSLFGSAIVGGTEDAGTAFRYTPATETFQRIYSLAPSNGVDGRRPGPIVSGGDGNFYGVTDLPNSGASSGWALFRLRPGAGATFTYERLRELDENVAGRPTQVKLTLGADGLLYGYAQAGGPSGNGTLFRFDPNEGGPPADPIAFTLVHAFPQLNTWNPSAPVLAADGFLYGVTNAGGAANRGAVYRLNATTAAVAILGDVPAASTPHIVNSALVPGPDGLLYGTSVAGPTVAGTPTPVEFDILRITPASGTATVAVGPLPGSAAPVGLVRTTAGGLYGPQRGGGPRGIVRFDPVANTVTTVTSLETTASLFLSPLTATSDGGVYALSQTAIPNPFTARIFTTRTFLLRLNPASPTGVDAITLGDDILDSIDRLVETSDGRLYFDARYQQTLAVVGVDRATGALRRVCTMPPSAIRLQHMSAGPDGALYGFVTGSQRLFRCDPATGTVTLTALPPDVGRIVEPLTTVGGMLYGAAVGQWPATGGTLFRLAPGGTLPALDSDGDGLPNVWETAYGLDPFGTGPGNGPADDPDGDGRTNAQEFADGTHPRGFETKLFAEGATGQFFHTMFDISLPGLSAATVRARFLTDTGAVVSTDLIVPPRSHLAFDPSTLPGLERETFSSIFESDVWMAIDRTMTWGAGGYGSHLETGLAAPSPTWYFAEGSTSGDFALFYLLQNPQTSAVSATVTYLRPSGQAPIERTYSLPPLSRTTIVVDNETAGLASTDVSAKITATAPIVAERAMYLSKPGQPFAAGHESAGVTAPALEWFLAEGATGTFFDLFVLIANPNPTAATVDVEYLRSSGAPLTKTYTVPAQSRMTIWVDDEELPAGSGHKPLAAGSVSTVVRSTNAVPIIVERAMWWPGPEITSDFWYEAHNSPGATGTATRWVLGGADIGGSDSADTYILIANTTSTNARAQVTLVTDDIGSRQETIDVPAKSRVTRSLRTLFGPVSPPDGRFGVIVESLAPASVPLVVERATYANPGGVFWGRGGNALAAPLP